MGAFDTKNVPPEAEGAPRRGKGCPWAVYSEKNLKKIPKNEARGSTIWSPKNEATVVIFLIDLLPILVAFDIKMLPGRGGGAWKGSGMPLGFGFKKHKNL